MEPTASIVEQWSRWLVASLLNGRDSYPTNVQNWYVTSCFLINRKMNSAIHKNILLGIFLFNNSDLGIIYIYLRPPRLLEYQYDITVGEALML